MASNNRHVQGFLKIIKIPCRHCITFQWLDWKGNTTTLLYGIILSNGQITKPIIRLLRLKFKMDLMFYIWNLCQMDRQVQNESLKTDIIVQTSFSESQVYAIFPGNQTWTNMVNSPSQIK